MEISLKTISYHDNYITAKYAKSVIIFLCIFVGSSGIFGLMNSKRIGKYKGFFYPATGIGYIMRLMYSPEGLIMTGPECKKERFSRYLCFYFR